MIQSNGQRFIDTIQESDRNFEEKSRLPETDSSGYLGIKTEAYFTQIYSDLTTEEIPLKDQFKHRFKHT